jgi:integrase
MRKDEIDLSRGLWFIPRLKSKNKLPMVLPLVEQALSIIERRMEEHPDSPWIFPSQSKTGHYAEPKDAWRRIRNKAGLPDVTIHDLRRTLASWQAGAGVPLQIIGKSLGQTSISSTQVYARVALDPVREAVQKATNLIEDASRKKKSE